jgi:hypothetical protein
MRRLVYSPRTYVFVRSRREGGKIYDLSDLCISGSIQRNVNAPSTAEFVVKNKNFILSSHNGQPALFQPMDAVTIWMQRIAGHPIQVFTGYLDSTPLYQIYPGNAQFKATCTLKRLMYTYFDPGLQAMTQWFAKYGWTMDPSSGMVFNAQELTTPLSATGGKTVEGFGQLLRQFLVEIAGWSEQAVLVSDLPVDLPKKAAKLWTTLQQNEERAQNELASVLSQIMSVRVNHDTQPATSSTGTVVKAIYAEASKSSIDPTVLILAALVLSGLQPAQLDTDPDSPTYGAGLYDALPDNDNIHWVGSPDRGDLNTTWDGISTKDIIDPNISTQAFVKRLKTDTTIAKSTGHWPKIDDSAFVLGKWIAEAADKTKFEAEIIEAVRDNVKAAKQLVEAFAKNTDATSISQDITATSFDTLVGDIMPDTVTWNTALSDTEKKFSTLYTATKGISVLASYLWVAHKYNLSLVNPVGTVSQANKFVADSQTIILNDGDANSKLQFAQWAGTRQGVEHVVFIHDDKVWEWQGGLAGGQIMINGQKDAANLEDLRRQGYQPDAVYVTATPFSKKPDWSGSSGDSKTIVEGEDPVNTQQLTFQDLVKISMASAFTTQFQFPVNMVESMLLRGNKSLMNDIPVIDGIQQLCKASLRNFMSLPSGEFVAFYPDYFGASGRKPYWSISDLEITNFGIQLSDDSLVTHAFVTGSTAAQPGTITWIDEVLSQGVVTVENAFTGTDFVAGERPGTDQSIFDAATFLQIYGARPLRKDMPIIRSHLFEFLYAWHLFMYKWAQQFQTRVDFTFQPEIMAGGLVAFTDHNLQMYVNGVTHSWDYSSGFSTSANLVAPSQINATGPSLPGMAIVSDLLKQSGMIGAIGE